jgi:hypothetical protein
MTGASFRAPDSKSHQARVGYRKSGAERNPVPSLLFSTERGSARILDSRCRGDAGGSEKPAQLTSNKAERPPRMCCPEHFQRLSRIGGRELLFE